MSTTQTQFPHLVDSDVVRREAAAQHGDLTDAAALLQAHRASVDPNIESTGMKKVNVEETRKVTDELYAADGDDTLVHTKLRDGGHDIDGLTIADAAVRGQALSVVAYDETGRPQHIVVPYTDKFVSIGESPAQKAERANAKYESDKILGGKAVQKQIQEAVAQAVAEAMANAQKEFAAREEEMRAERDETLSEVESDGEGDGSGSSDGEGFPRRKDDLRVLADKHNVELNASDNIDTMIEKLKDAGVKPDPEGDSES